ncbi:MAG: BlaI/MecI/CopY family transcriptional regulator, partial [Eudoraea sp.]|nr:BlaI/MecI/CopY family transcriptional regulator [Eudoraea sp.]
DKEYVGHEAFGNTHRYYPLVTKEAYRKQFVNSSLVDFYDNSYKSMVSFFAKEEKISVEDLKEIINLIEKNK